MKNTERFVLTPLAAAMLVKRANFQATDAGEEYVSKACTKTLYKAPLQGVRGKEMFVKHLSAPPNFVGGKHMHPDPVFVYVLEGELTVERARGPKTFKAGELYSEDINAAMVGKNLSATDDVELLVFQVGDIGKPMMIKVM